MLAVANCCCDDGLKDCAIGTAPVDTLTGWTQDAGTWTDAGTTLTTTSDNASLSFNTANPDGPTDPTAARILTVKGSALGDCPRLALCWLDHDNYLALEVQVGDGSTCGAARVVRRSAGVETVIGADVPVRTAIANRTFRMTAFYKPAAEEMRCEIFDSGGPRQIAFLRTGVQTTGGDKAALATGTVNGTVTFGTAGTALEFVYNHHVSNAQSCVIEPSCTVHSSATGGTSTGLPTSLCEWDTVSGSWNIDAAGNLTQSASGGGIIVSKIEEFTESGVYEIQLPGAGLGFRAPVFDYVDSSNYHYLTSDFGTKLMKVSGGVETMVHRFSGGVFFVTSVAVNGGTVLVNGLHRVQTTLHGGKRFGIYVQSTSAIISSYSLGLRTTCETRDDPERNCPWKVKCGTFIDNDGTIEDANTGDDNTTAYYGDYGNGLKVVLAGIGGSCPECANQNGTIITTTPGCTASASLPGFAGIFYSGSGGACCQNGEILRTVRIGNDVVSFQVAMDCTTQIGPPLIIENLIRAYWTYPLSTAEKCDATAILNQPMTMGAFEELSRCTIASATATLSSVPYVN